ncbi:hypothetical protein ACIG3E_32700 [Streptomyces sp. NPDC053474]|uniref:hypothetical protein n=1 Tax=Streptomyces sp. NPDC053474 TaxID=3365704 RepID=UPI0037D18E16
MRYLVDRSGTLPSYLAPPPPELFTAGWLAHADGGARLKLTARGRDALRAHAAQVCAREQEPASVTRNPLRGGLHDPAEPIRRLYHRVSGTEIRPGDSVTDPAGHRATYLGPTMHSADGGTTWSPGFNARVHYAEYGDGWLYPPEAISAVYAAQPAAPRFAPVTPESGR